MRINASKDYQRRYLEEINRRRIYNRKQPRTKICKPITLEELRALNFEPGASGIRAMRCKQRTCVDMFNTITDIIDDGRITALTSAILVQIARLVNGTLTREELSELFYLLNNRCPYLVFSELDRDYSIIVERCPGDYHHTLYVPAYSAPKEYRDLIAEGNYHDRLTDCFYDESAIEKHR